MQVKLPLPDGTNPKSQISETDQIDTDGQLLTVTDVDETVATETHGGLLYGVYDLLATHQVLSSEELSTLESQIGNGLTARLEYQDADSQWTVVTNPLFHPHNPVDAKNSPLAKGDLVSLGSNGFARFLGWRGDSTPTFALRTPGRPASRMGRLQLNGSDSLFGTGDDTTVSELLL